MRPALDDLALLQHDDLVAIPDRAQTMCDDDAGAAGSAQIVVDRLLRDRIERGRGFIENDDGGAADESTRELAPGSAELRLRGGEPEFVVSTPPAEEAAPEPVAPPLPDADDGATARINLRLPEQLKAGVEQAASRERLSVNAWLVRAVGAALQGGGDRPSRHGGGHIGQAYKGWVS